VFQQRPAKSRAGTVVILQPVKERVVGAANKGEGERAEIKAEEMAAQGAGIEIVALHFRARDTKKSP
jgi:hypothetical protein